MRRQTVDMPNRSSPLLPADAAARSLARALLSEARTAALGTLDPTSGTPVVTRIGLSQTPEGQPLTLISDLSGHSRALGSDARCSILVGQPAVRGDPLTAPRLTLQCIARVCQTDSPVRAALRASYLSRNPKAALYIDFADFRLVELRVASAFLNAGFGRAHELDPADLGLPPFG